MKSLSKNFLAPFDLGEIVHQKLVGGGCISETRRVFLDSGKSYFLKLNEQAPADFFTSEAKSLEALSIENSLRVPNVMVAERNFILLEDLGAGSPNSEYWDTLGEGLANLHKIESNTFGFTTDNYCGSTPQRNPSMKNGYEFFGQYRLITLSLKAFEQQLLKKEELKQIEFIASNLTNLIPHQNPVLIHGDLWSGNVHCDEQGKPCLVDPAAYWGWAEAELAMSELFGGFDQRFYESYESCSKIDNRWRERSQLYNLYHLLNHLIIFGTRYLGQIKLVLDRFA